MWETFLVRFTCLCYHRLQNISQIPCIVINYRLFWFCILLYSFNFTIMILFVVLISLLFIVNSSRIIFVCTCWRCKKIVATVWRLHDHINSVYCGIFCCPCWRCDNTLWHMIRVHGNIFCCPCWGCLGFLSLFGYFTLISEVFTVVYFTTLDGNVIKLLFLFWDFTTTVGSV